MPNITGTTYEDTRNRYVEYSGTATAITQTFTFERMQDGMVFRNKGKTPVTLTVDGKSFNVPPNAVIDIDDKSFISFDVRTQSGSHPFELKAFAEKAKGGGGSDTELRGEFEVFKQDTTSLLAQNETKVKVLSDNTRIKESDIEALHSLLKSGKGIRYAILGDSTEAGVGQTGAGTYGETNHINVFSAQVAFALSMIVNDENFMPVDNNMWNITNPTYSTGAVDFLLPKYQLKVSENPSITYSVKQKTSYKYNKLTVYYIERTSAAAPLFDIVANGITTPIDTYVAPVTYAGTNYNINARVRKVTVAIPATENVSFTINNFRLADRGTGIGTDGTAIIFGFALGSGVDFINYAVSSTTLLNNSSANQTRGITTTERLQKAYDFGANVFSMGWGTNDSKAGVSTQETFELDLATRIDEIRAYNPNAIIFLNTDPAGATGSEYENNILYNKSIAKVALEKDVSLIDFQYIIDRMDRATVISDNVHPSQAGYTVLGKALATSFKFPFVFKESLSSVNPVSDYDQGELFKSVTLSGTNTTGSYAEIAQINVDRPSGKYNMRLSAQINLASTTDITDVVFYIELEVFNQKGQIASSGVVEIDRKYVNVYGLGGSEVKTAVVNLEGLYKTNLGRSFRAKLFGKNYQIRVADSKSQFHMMFF